MIQFKKITVHNFGSLCSRALDLQNKGFCLVSGQNNYAKDNALSNGVAKVYLVQFVMLTGETVSGLSLV